MNRNPAYRLEFRPKAKKQFDRLPNDVRPRIAAAINGLSANPRPHGCLKMSGEDTLYRIRVGDYRIIYSIEDVVMLVLVVRVGARKSVYRGL